MDILLCKLPCVTPGYTLQRPFLQVCLIRRGRDHVNPVGPRAYFDPPSLRGPPRSASAGDVMLIILSYLKIREDARFTPPAVIPERTDWSGHLNPLSDFSALCRLKRIISYATSVSPQLSTEGPLLHRHQRRASTLTYLTIPSARASVFTKFRPNV